MYQKLNSINLRRLQVAYAVGEMRSVTAAAKRLNMTPPAVTKSLKELEFGLSTELFHRTSSGMFPTEAGEIFLIHAAKALHEIDRGREEVSLLISGKGGRLSVGCTVDAARPALTRALGRVLSKRPDIDLKLVGGTFESLLREIQSGSLDFFLGIATDGLALPGLVVEPLYRDELRVVVRPGHPLLEREDLTLKDLSDFRWVLNHSEGPFFDGLRQSFESQNLSYPSNPVIVEPISLIRGILHNSDLISAMTSSRVREELELKQLIALSLELKETHQVISIIRRSEPFQSTWSKELVSLLKRATSTTAPDEKADDGLPSPP